jgi:hypothetical protein
MLLLRQRSVLRAALVANSEKRILEIGLLDCSAQKEGLVMGACELDKCFTGRPVPEKLRPLQLAGAEHGEVGQRPAHHRDLIAGVEARAGLAVLVDLVGHGVAFGDAEAEVREVVGDAGEEADGKHLVLFRLGEQRFKDGVACAQAAAVFADDDGADLGQVRAVEMQSAAAQELGLAGGVFRIGAAGNGEIADVLADFGVAAAQQCAVAGERVDQIEDVAGVLEAGLVDVDRRGWREAARGR